MTQETTKTHAASTRSSHAAKPANDDIRRAATNARAPILFRTRVGARTEAEKTYWPRPGGIGDGELKGLGFGSRTFRERYKPGVDAIGYVAGCAMLRNCAARYHVPLAKAGWSGLPDLLARQDDLNADRYGGWLYEDGFLKEQTGCHWEMQQAMLRFEPHPNSPVSLVDRGIRVRLPEGYELRSFEKDVQGDEPVLAHLFRIIAGG